METKLWVNVFTTAQLNEFNVPAHWQLRSFRAQNPQAETERATDSLPASEGVSARTLGP
jgi:hypothetical protein